MIGMLLGRNRANEKATYCRPFFMVYDPRELCDWIVYLGYYFDLYELFDVSKVGFVMCKLKSAVLNYWTSVERQLGRTYARPIETWDEMKEKLKEKFIPFKSRVFKELFYLRQGGLSVTEYKLKFKELVFECGFKINHFPTIYLFYNGMRLDFKSELILHVLKSVKTDISFGFRARIVHFQN